MADYKVAYGKKETIEVAIREGIIPPGSIILTENSDEIFFYDLDKKLLTYQEKYKFSNKPEAEQWVNKYDCNGQIISIHEEDKCIAYIVGYNKQLVPLLSSNSQELTEEQKLIVRDNIHAADASLEDTKLPSPEEASVGQFIRILEVDENGKILKTEAVDEPDSDDALELAIEVGLVDPISDESSILLTDEQGNLFTF